jgi:hypothetical protein
MATYYLIAIGAGVLSFLLQMSAALGSIGAMLLVFLTPLPLFMAGLSKGTLAAAIGGGVATLLGALTVGLPFALQYLVTMAAPVTLLCRNALLARPGPQGDLEWYPLGYLAVWLAGLAAFFFLAVVAYHHLAGSDLLTVLETTIRKAGPLMGVEAQIEMFVATVPYLPSALAVMWMLALTVNGALAQGLLLRFARNIRPHVDIAELLLPKFYFLAFGAAVALSLLDGYAGMIGKTLAAIAALPYFLQGLAAIHARIRNWTGRAFVLILLYGFILPVFWPTGLIIVGLGLFEHANRLSRTGRGNDDGGKEE